MPPKQKAEGKDIDPKDVVKQKENGKDKSENTEGEKLPPEGDKSKVEKAKDSKTHKSHSSSTGSSSHKKLETARPDPTVKLLENMCGILNRGFITLSSDMKTYQNTMSSELQLSYDFFGVQSMFKRYDSKTYS